MPSDKIGFIFKELGKPEPKIELEELSAMGNGAVEGAPGKRDGTWGKKDFSKENEEEKKRSRLIRRDNVDLSTIDEVIRLIMERGIMQ